MTLHGMNSGWSGMTLWVAVEASTWWTSEMRIFCGGLFLV
jgi:hypothetical protein